MRRDSRTGLFALDDEGGFLDLRFTDDHKLMDLPCTGRLSAGQTAACAARGVSPRDRMLQESRIAFERFLDPDMDHLDASHPTA